MRREKTPDLLDRRQRVAAALLLAAIKLPAPVAHVVAHWKEAERALPGATMEEVFRNDRREALCDARALIDEMLSEGGEDA